MDPPERSVTAPVAADRHGIELRIALDMARRAVLITPLVMLVLGLLRGFDAAGAVALAVAIVVANWVGAAALLGWAARRSPNMLLGVALFGFIGRLALLTAVGVGIKELDIVDWPVFCVTLLVAYAGLLVWELRYVSFSLASPGLRPSADRRSVSAQGLPLSRSWRLRRRAARALATPRRVGGEP